MGRWYYKLKKPEYYLQPGRLLQKWLGGSREMPVKTSYGGHIFCDPGDAMGKAIVNTGILDLVVSEMCLRLVKSDGFCIDAGANIGMMSQIMSLAAGKTGLVWSFEPNPEVYRLLLANTSLLPFQNLRCFQMALGSTKGTGFLNFPTYYKKNNGTAFVARNASENSLSVETNSLDNLLEGTSRRVQLLKIDTEGSELEILKGCTGLLESKRIAHIIFEGGRKRPDAVFAFLSSFGYSILRIEKGWLSPVLCGIEEPSGIPGWETANFLATLTKAEDMRLTQKPGYRCLTRVF